MATDNERKEHEKNFKLNAFDRAVVYEIIKKLQELEGTNTDAMKVLVDINTGIILALWEKEDIDKIIQVLTDSVKHGINLCYTSEEVKPN